MINDFLKIIANQQNARFTVHGKSVANGNGFIHASTPLTMKVEGTPKRTLAPDVDFELKEGDVWKSWNGEVESKMGEVDLGTLTWTFIDSSFFRANVSDMIKNLDGTKIVVKCPKYTALTSRYGNQMTTDKAISSTLGNNFIMIKDDAFNGDANAFKTAMTGVKCLFELATPTTTTQKSLMTPRAITSIIDAHGFELEFEKK